MNENTGPVTIAQKVVDAYRQIDSWNKPHMRDGKEAPPVDVILACAVIDLTAKVERVEALAEALDVEAAKEREKPNRTPHDHGWDDACTVAAHRIRAALNGETHA